MEEVMKVEQTFSPADFHRQAAAGSATQEISLSVKLVANVIFFMLEGKLLPGLKDHLIGVLAELGNSSTDYANLKYVQSPALSTSRLTRYRAGEKVAKLLNMVGEAHNPHYNLARAEKKQRDTDAKVDRIERELKKMKTGSIFGQLSEPLAGRGSWGQAYMNAGKDDKKAILFGLHVQAIDKASFTGDEVVPQDTLSRVIKVLKYMLAEGAGNLASTDYALVLFHQLHARELGF